MSRPWLALILILFCLPLFVGLRSRDLETDEAIYSYAVDKILEDGDWLRPKSSPTNDIVFLEKPPLKFWIVAAPIRAGLLPHDEFGLRFWDVVFGSAAFVYVFLIGSRLAGPVCGAVGVLGLFVHFQLLFDHGLRTNSMEGPLFLAYCGGVYHFLAWARDRTARHAWHAVAVGLYFVLGFMTKFVAAIFLPAVLVLAALAAPRVRARIIEDRQDWVRSLLVVLACTAPWFVWANIEFGGFLWKTMLAEHVYVRFTDGVDPTHLQPWNYYLVTIWRNFSAAGLQWFLASGLVTLVVLSVRRRSFEGAVILLWAVVPLTLISLGSSKLYHYAYPFLPPLTLAIGYLAALIVMLAPVVVGRWFSRLDGFVAARAAWFAANATRPALQTIAGAVIWGGTALILVALATGGVEIEVAGRRIFKSAGLWRPLALVILAAAIARRPRAAATLLVVLLLVWTAPAPKYREVIDQLTVQKHPLRDVANCILRVQNEAAVEPGMWVDADEARWLEGINIWHPIYYYLRRIQPWTVNSTPSLDRLLGYVHDPSLARPVLVREQRYIDYLGGAGGDALRRGGLPPALELLGYTLLLPGPYRPCSSEGRLVAGR